MCVCVCVYVCDGGTLKAFIRNLWEPTILNQPGRQREKGIGVHRVPREKGAELGD